MHDSIRTVNLADAFSRFQDQWSPKVVAQVNDFHVKLAKLEGEFVWHRHADEDELFMVVEGTLQILLRDGEITLAPAELTVIPKDVEHCPVAEGECLVMLLEPATTRNTGEVVNERTVEDPERLA